mmetsp:Transcript_62410/g.110034  ORF Transcript_62410/g.110034 Transcript_62410/m.110034 type:complete len:222 (-) Transcript_62410:272-937(-)
MGSFVSVTSEVSTSWLTSGLDRPLIPSAMLVAGAGAALRLAIGTYPCGVAIIPGGGAFLPLGGTAVRILPLVLAGTVLVALRSPLVLPWLGSCTNGEFGAELTAGLLNALSAAKVLLGPAVLKAPTAPAPGVAMLSAGAGFGATFTPGAVGGLKGSTIAAYGLAASTGAELLKISLADSKLLSLPLPIFLALLVEVYGEAAPGGGAANRSAPLLGAPKALA